MTRPRPATEGVTSAAGDNPWQLTLFSYDSEGRVTDKWIYTGDRDEWDTHLAYAYNRQGEITRRKIKVGADSLYQHYSYNRRGLLDSVFVTTTGIPPANPDPEVVYSYTASGAIDHIDFKGSNDADYEYTIRDWVESINNVGSPGGNFAAEYNYTDNGNVDIVNFHNPQVQSGGGPGTYQWDFGYDGLNRLTEADFGDNGTTGIFDVAGLDYDDAGNITDLQRRDETGNLIDNLAYSYAGSNRLGSVTDAVSTTSAGWDAEDATFGYDPNGNLTSQSGKLTDVAYDHRNLPVHFYLDGGNELIANYNADGQRILKELAGGSWQFYVMDGQQTLAVIEDGTLSHINLVGNSTFGRWEPGGARRYYVTDHLGSTRAVVDNNGNVLETFDYYPGGLHMPQRTSTTGNTIEKFTGKERDESLGLDYFGARYYDPALWRWTSTDPLASKYPSLSPYNYVANNPVNAFDPDGQDIWFVHGTKSSPNTWRRNNIDYARRWASALDDRIGGRFNWNISSWTNTRLSRENAAEKLADQIEEAYRRNPEMLVQLVGHSHGGNVAIMAANILRDRGINVDRLILLGTPSRSLYTVDDELMELTQVINVYSENDFWQQLGGIDFSFIPRLTRLAGRKRPKTEDAHEVDVTLVDDGSVEHTTVHTTQEIIDLIDDFLNSEESKE